MKIGVNLRIDLDKVDESAVFVGKKGRYLNAVAFIDIDNVGQYGDNGMIKQDAGEGQEGTILGNSTIFWNDTQPLPAKPQQPQQAPQQSQPQQPPAKDYTQDINAYWGLSEQARTAHWGRLSADVQNAIIAANG